MIDFIKAHPTDRATFKERILNPENGFNVIGNYHLNPDGKGQMLYPLKSSLNNIELRITEKTAYLKNSLHKYNNLLSGRGNHNHNNFHHCEVIEAIEDIEEHLDIKADDFKLTMFEFGLNLCIDDSPTTILNNCILLHKNIAPTVDSNYKGNERIKKFTHYNYEIKIYDKGKQYNLNKHILRVEIKFKSTREFNQLGIYTLEDLKNANLMDSLVEYLMKRVSEIAILDNWREKKGISPEDKVVLSEFTNPFFWLDQKERKSHTTHHRKRKKLQEVIERNELFRTKGWLLSQIYEQYILLMDCPSTGMVLAA